MKTYQGDVLKVVLSVKDGSFLGVEDKDGNPIKAHEPKFDTDGEVNFTGSALDVVTFAKPPSATRGKTLRGTVVCTWVRAPNGNWYKVCTTI